MARPTVQQFIETWEKSDCVAEVADKTKLRKSTVQAKATQLRKLGIPLKKFKGTRHRINIEEALEVLAKIRGTSVAALKKEAAHSQRRNGGHGGRPPSGRFASLAEASREETRAGRNPRHRAAQPPPSLRRRWILRAGMASSVICQRPSLRLATKLNLPR